MMQGNRGAALAVMAGAGLLLGGAGAAHASQTFNIRESGTPTDTMVFAPFDTSQGTLTEVDITLSSPPTVGIGSTFGITGGEGGANGTASFTANLDITGPGSEALFTGAASASAACTNVSGKGSFDCSNGPNLPTVAAGGFSPDPAVLTAPADLALWDNGSNVDVVASIDNFLRNDTCNLPLNQGSCSQVDDVLFAGQVSVNYLYTPPTTTGVPEPQSMTLLAAGLLGLGLVRFRRG